jgi:UDPglucose 6-dehydrogenase
MKLGIIGTGYVGLVTGICFAEGGNDVICMDNNPEVVEKLKKGICTIYEPQLETLLQRNLKEKRLQFTNDLKATIENSDIIFLCLPTPPNEDGSADLRHVLSVSELIAENLKSEKIIVAKSTIPVGTSEKIKEIFKDKTAVKINYVFNPEFLKEGSAVDDFMYPDRVIIGSESEAAIEVMKDLYSPFMRTSDRLLVMDEKSAEVTKYAANAMLAVRISFMNNIAALCEATGANVDSIRIGIGTDERIGSKFLFPGPGYGGSCFPKDTKAIIKTGEEYGIEMKLINAAEEINHEQKRIIFRKVKNYFKENLKGKKIAVWGLSYKPRTDDIRESPSLVLIKELIENEVTISAYDPEAMEKAKEYFSESNGKLSFSQNYYDALFECDALVIMTEWNEFRNPDFNRIKDNLRSPVIFDGRNLYNPEVMAESGFYYESIGRKKINSIKKIEKE